MSFFDKEQDRHTLSSLERIRQGIICGICGNFLRNTYNLPCGHNFCSDCLRDALGDKSLCPSCRNPAWQKDIVKNAQADSVVHEWTEHCEARFQRHVARAAADNDDETDSMRNDMSTDEDADEEEQLLNKAAPPPAEAPSSATGKRSTTGRHDVEAEVQNFGGRVMAETRTIQEVPEGGARGLARATSTHEVDSEADTAADAAASACARSSPQKCRSFALEQEKENVSSTPTYMTPSNSFEAKVEAGNAISCQQNNQSSEKKSSSGQCWSSSPPGKSDGSQSENRPNTPQSARHDQFDLPITGGHSRNPLGQGRERAHAQPEVPRLQQIANENLASELSTTYPLAKGRKRILSPFSQRLASIGQEARVTAHGQKAGGKDSTTFNFSGSLPDTCDVLGLDSPTQTPMRSHVFISTPPTLKLGKAEVGAGKPAQVDGLEAESVLSVPIAGEKSGEEPCSAACGKPFPGRFLLQLGEGPSEGAEQRSTQQIGSCTRNQGISGPEEDEDSHGTADIADSRDSTAGGDAPCGAAMTATGSQEGQTDRRAGSSGERSEVDEDVEDASSDGSAAGYGTDLEEPPLTTGNRQALPIRSPVRCDGRSNEPLANTSACKDAGGDGDDVLITLSPPLCPGNGDSHESPQYESSSQPERLEGEGGREAEQATEENIEVDHETETETFESPETVRGSLSGSSSRQLTSPTSTALTSGGVRAAGPSLFPRESSPSADNIGLTGESECSPRAHRNTNAYNQSKAVAMTAVNVSPHTDREGREGERSPEDRETGPTDGDAGETARDSAPEAMSLALGEESASPGEAGEPTGGGASDTPAGIESNIPAIAGTRADERVSDEIVEGEVDHTRPQALELLTGNSRIADASETLIQSGERKTPKERNRSKAGQDGIVERVLYVPETLPSQSLRLSQHISEGADTGSVVSHKVDGKDETQCLSEASLENNGAGLLGGVVRGADVKVKASGAVRAGDGIHEANASLKEVGRFPVSNGTPNGRLPTGAGRRVGCETALASFVAKHTGANTMEKQDNTMGRMLYVPETLPSLSLGSSQHRSNEEGAAEVVTRKGEGSDESRGLLDASLESNGAGLLVAAREGRMALKASEAVGADDAVDDSVASLTETRGYGVSHKVTYDRLLTDADRKIERGTGIALSPAKGDNDGTTEKQDTTAGRVLHVPETLPSQTLGLSQQRPDDVGAANVAAGKGEGSDETRCMSESLLENDAACLLEGAARGAHVELKVSEAIGTDDTVDDVNARLDDTGALLNSGSSTDNRFPAEVGGRVGRGRVATPSPVEKESSDTMKPSPADSTAHPDKDHVRDESLKCRDGVVAETTPFDAPPEERSRNDKASTPVKKGRRGAGDCRASSLSVPDTARVGSLLSQEVPETPCAAWGGDSAVTRETGDICETAEGAMTNDNSSIVQHSEVPETPQSLRKGSAETPSTIDETPAVSGPEGGVHEGPSSGISPAKSSNIGSKRSVDSAGITPTRFQGDRGVGDKRLRATPPEGTPHVCGGASADAGCTSDAESPPATESRAVGTPLILRGGSGEVSGPGEDSEADNSVDDYRGDDYREDVGDYHGDEDIHHGDDMQTKHKNDDGMLPMLSTTDISSARSTTPAKAVPNPYAKDSHLEMQPDEEERVIPPASTESAWLQRRTAEGGGGKQAIGASLKRRKPPRANSAMMGFVAPARGSGLSRGPSALGNGAVDMIAREKEGLASSNSILAAGHGGIQSGKGSRSSTWQGTVTGIASFSSLDETLPSYAAPDTEDINALAAGFPAKDVRKPGDIFSEDVELSDPADRGHRRAIDLAHDGISVKENNRVERLDGSGIAKQPYVGRKRLRGGGDAKIDKASNSPQRKNSAGKGIGRSPVVLSLLGCEQWEQKRAMMLCHKLGQTRLHTCLVVDTTHVVIGSAHAADAEGDEGNFPHNDSSVRRQLVSHDLEGYLEAVMLGLWVLDFSWVEACLKPSTKLKSASRKKRGGNRKGNLKILRDLGLAPAREFEIAGCFHEHDGCNPRRGRVCKATVEKLFTGLEFHIVTGAEESETALDSPSGSRDKTEQLTRLLCLGGGDIPMNASSRRRERQALKDKGTKKQKKTKRRIRSFVDNPFGIEKMSDSDGDALSSGEDSAQQEGVVVVAMADETRRGVGPRLAQAARDCANNFSMVLAVVSQAWVRRSIEEGSRLSFDHFSLDSNSDGSSPEKNKSTANGHPDSILPPFLAAEKISVEKGKGGIVVGQPVRRRGRLDTHNQRRKGADGRGGGASSREVVIDLDGSARRNRKGVSSSEMISPPIVSIDAARQTEKQQRLERIIKEAEEIVGDADGQPLRDEETRRAEAELLAKRRTSTSDDEFTFTKVGEQKDEDSQTSFWNPAYSKDLMAKAGIEADPKETEGPSNSDITAVEKKMSRALEDAGYLELPSEQKLGEFWFDNVYEGLIMRRGDAVENAARERGCPVGIMRRVLESTEILHTQVIEDRLKSLEEGLEFRLWDENESATWASQSQGASIDDALEIL